ncbi:MAG: sensor histidine kinase [Acidimicrobiales bacterium]
MRRRLEPLLPALVLLGTVVAAVIVYLLISSAEQRGVDALEESVTAEVEALAASQNQRFASSFGSAQGLSGGLDGEPFRLTPDSPEDRGALEGLLQLLPEPRSGFYLLDLQGTITQGVLFKEDDALGSTFDMPGFAELVEAGGLERGGVLPVGDGLTTDEPVITFILPIREKSPDPQIPGPRRGAFVFEQVVAADSQFNQEIGALQRGETGFYYFYDNRGSVIASNDTATIGNMLDDQRMLTDEHGFHRFDGDIVVLSDVPGPQWRVAFRQDEGEFKRALAGPLQSTGRILIVALLVAGALLMVSLTRRLQAARREQERLRLLNEAQQEFISIVSHELRTPVAGVLGFLETSLDHWDAMSDPERRTAVARAASNARRLQAMTRDVLDTQSVEVGQLVHVFERLDLAREVRIAVDAAREFDRDRTIEVQLPDEPVWVDGDADRLQQVLANLIDNARKNSPAAEPIGVELALRDGAAEVVVSDRGPGIAGDVLERIFDKFVRGRGDAVSGTGLGLYISRQIVSAHHGRIWAESDPGEGARFRFTIPVEADAPVPTPTA